MNIHAMLFTAAAAALLSAGLAAGTATAQHLDEGPIFNNSIIHPIIHPDGPVPPEVRFSFSDDDLAWMAAREGAGVIVHHGAQLPLEGYAATLAHVERLDFFTTQPVDPAAISADMVRAVMAGEVSNWADLGGSDQPITVYMPEDSLKREAIAAQMRRAGVDAPPPGRMRADYAGLADALREDPGAFVVGLRSEAAWEGTPPAARRISPTGRDGVGLAFAMPIQIYVKSGDPAAEAAAAQLLAIVKARAAQDRMVYPAAQTLEALGLPK